MKVIIAEILMINLDNDALFEQLFTETQHKREMGAPSWQPGANIQTSPEFEALKQETSIDLKLGRLAREDSLKDVEDISYSRLLTLASAPIAGAKMGLLKSLSWDDLPSLPAFAMAKSRGISVFNWDVSSHISAPAYITSDRIGLYERVQIFLTLSNISPPKDKVASAITFAVPYAFNKLSSDEQQYLVFEAIANSTMYDPEAQGTGYGVERADIPRLFMFKIILSSGRLGATCKPRENELATVRWRLGLMNTLIAYFTYVQNGLSDPLVRHHVTTALAEYTSLTGIDTLERFVSVANKAMGASKMALAQHANSNPVS